jgi:Tol biopolymer transport system component
VRILFGAQSRGLSLCYTGSRVTARIFLLVALALVLALPGSGLGGSYVPPPGDTYPTWAPDGATIAFLTARGGPHLALVDSDGSGEERRSIDVFGVPYPDPAAVALSPDWRWAAVQRFTGSGFRLAAIRLDGSEERQLASASYGTRPAWSPDSRRIAFRQADGALVSIGIDGGDVVHLSGGGAAPSWSPDGVQIAYSGGSPENLDIHVVKPDGLNDRSLAGGPGAQLEPKWSPDGTRIAFLTQPAVGREFALATVRSDGADLETYVGPGVSNPSSFAWTPDGTAIVFAKALVQGVFRLDLATGQASRLTPFGGAPAVSPDGLRIAFAAGGECRDRNGIYVATIGEDPRRVTNDCRVFGTPRADVIRGTALADVLVGLGGDDRLLAKDPGYVGDTLLGGDGDDLLIGAYRGDLLRGGPGRDRLLGGRSADELEGGPGRDVIDGQRGQDRIDARDGVPDVVRCGTNDLHRVPERDEAWVDRIDVVEACEIVHRRR